jgi:hypothetical protein
MRTFSLLTGEKVDCGDLSDAKANKTLAEMNGYWGICCVFWQRRGDRG